MNESRYTIDVTSAHSQQTETSPLKQNDSKRNLLTRILCSSESENDQGSLKSIVLFFLILSIIITLGLLAQIYYGGYKIEPHGSVVSDNSDCSEIGIQILKKGGNAVDAAIASTMCLGVVNFHISGLGGGGHILIYDHKKQKALDIIDFYPSVPDSLVGKEIDTSIEGLSVGVPGLLLGLWEAHQKYGKLKWEELLMPASNLARKGFIVDKNIIFSRTRLNRFSKNNRKLANILNSLNEETPVTFPDLAATLELIAKNGPQVFYNGSLAMDIVYSVKKANGNMTAGDISQYRTSHGDLLRAKFGPFNVLASGSSSAGTLLISALSGIQHLDITPEDDVSSIVLGLSDFLHDSYIKFLEKNNAAPLTSEPAASQVLTVDNNELYVTAVSSLNTFLGSQLFTDSGFLLNNAITNGGFNDDKKPISFGASAIIVERGEICGKRLLLGSGDVTLAAQVLTNALIFKQNISYSIESPRFYINNLPRFIRVEDFHTPFYDAKTLNKLRVLLQIERFPLPYKSVNIIQKIGDAVTAHSDSRVNGSALDF